jgi:hypothetical protein
MLLQEAALRGPAEGYNQCEMGGGQTRMPGPRISWAQPTCVFRRIPRGLSCVTVFCMLELATT